MQQGKGQDIEQILTAGYLSVHKFGGTSMANFAAMQHSAEVVLKIKGPVLIVVSAAASVTRTLMHLAHPSTHEVERQNLLAVLRKTHMDILNAIPCSQSVQDKVDFFLNEAARLSGSLQSTRNLIDLDELLSFGERMSSLIFSHVLQALNKDALCFDVREVMKTTAHFGEAEPLLEEVKERAQAVLLPLCQEKIIVTQGFVGQTLTGDTTTLGKESSDYSAAILAEALGAYYFAIWSDMAGVFTGDPKLVPTAQPIKKMSMQNALALTEAGAKVLHPRTMLPAIRGKMSFFVGSSQGRPGGTWVVSEAHQEQPWICAVNLRSEQILLSCDHALGQQPGQKIDLIGAQIVQTFRKAEIEPAFIYSDHLSTTILLDDSLREFRRESILTPSLCATLEAITPIKFECNLQLIAIVGNRLEVHAGLRDILAHFIKTYKIRILSFGMSAHALFIVVHEAREIAIEMVQALHQQLFEN